MGVELVAGAQDPDPRTTGRLDEEPQPRPATADRPCHRRPRRACDALTANPWLPRSEARVKFRASRSAQPLFASAELDDCIEEASGGCTIDCSVIESQAKDGLRPDLYAALDRDRKVADPPETEYPDLWGIKDWGECVDAERAEVRDCEGAIGDIALRECSATCGVDQPVTF